MGRVTNKGRKFPPNPISVEDIVRVLNSCVPQGNSKAERLSAIRLRALVILLWRSGLRISEALALEPQDLIRQNMSIVVRSGKGGKRRISAMDAWGWKELERWLTIREELPLGPVFCAVRGRNTGILPLIDSDVRRQLREVSIRSGINRRANAHSFRHEHAVELWREGKDMYTIQHQLGHARLDVTAQYLKGIALIELLEPITQRSPPVIRVDLT